MPQLTVSLFMSSERKFKLDAGTGHNLFLIVPSDITIGQQKQEAGISNKIRSFLSNSGGCCIRMSRLRRIMIPLEASRGGQSGNREEGAGLTQQIEEKHRCWS